MTVEAFSFFVNEVLESPVRIFQFEGSQVFTTLPREALEDYVRRLRASAPMLDYPLPVGAHLRALGAVVDLPEPEITELATLIDGEWIVDATMVTGFGTTKRGAILAFVRAAKRPVARTELEERFGRINLGDDFVFVDHGVVAVPETIPDWDRWRQRLPRVVRSLLERHGPDRQWTTHELVPLLAEEADLPAWLNDWTLGSLLRDSPEIRYLGRNVVSLTEPTEGRLHVHELAVEMVEAGGAPIMEQVLLRSLQERRGLGPHTWAMLRMRRPFVFFDDGRVGLLPRDVAGAAPAIERFCDALFARLDARQAGLRNDEVREVLATLGEPIANWDVRLARSLLRHDGRFRCAPGGAVGLSEWEDVRAPSQREALEELMIEHEGVVPVEQAMSALPTASGEPLSRGRIGLLANSIRARLVGAYIEWMPEAASSRTPGVSPLLERVIMALPEETVPVFRLLLDTLPSREVLRASLSEWTRVMLAEAVHNTNVESVQVERLASIAEALLRRLATAADGEEARLYSAAVQYLASVDDAQTDTALGGLDDDEAVLEVVSTTLASVPP